MSPPRTLEWLGDHTGFLRLLDQTRLPTELTYRDCRTVADVWEAIRSLCVRGAPAIGVAAAYGVVLGVREDGPRKASERLRTSRPTAVNLFWALDGMDRVADSLPLTCPAPRSAHACSPKQIVSRRKTAEPVGPSALRVRS